MATYKSKPDWSLAFSDANAIMFNKVIGDYEFGVIKENGRVFTDHAQGSEFRIGAWNIFERLEDVNTKANSKYDRNITDRNGNKACVDVYDVLVAFNVACPAIQHALKKLLCTGIRGHKDAAQDLIEASNSITRAIELLGNK